MRLTVVRDRIRIDSDRRRRLENRVCHRPAGRGVDVVAVKRPGVGVRARCRMERNTEQPGEIEPPGACRRASRAVREVVIGSRERSDRDRRGLLHGLHRHGVDEGHPVVLNLARAGDGGGGLARELQDVRPGRERDGSSLQRLPRAGVDLPGEPCPHHRATQTDDDARGAAHVAGRRGDERDAIGAGDRDIERLVEVRLPLQGSDLCSVWRGGERDTDTVGIGEQERSVVTPVEAAPPTAVAGERTDVEAILPPSSEGRVPAPRRGRALETSINDRHRRVTEEFSRLLARHKPRGRHLEAGA